MARSIIHAEGETEETFIKKALAPHLYCFGYQIISARLLGNSRTRARRGGGENQSLKNPKTLISFI